MKDNTAKDLGELIAKRMEEENPKLIRDVRQLVQNLIKPLQKPWYVRAYNHVKDIFYGSYK